MHRILNCSHVFTLSLFFFSDSNLATFFSRELFHIFVVLQIKQRENDIALKYYQKAVNSMEKLSWEERQFALVRGVLAGNVFDWGAKAVSE